jgi:hypothetical protein
MVRARVTRARIDVDRATMRVRVSTRARIVVNQATVRRLWRSIQA